ncbi:MAG: translation elongation factor 4 [Candidatus Margulisiibacteriota bacterium]|jgi:GTP-binding protein LepA
MQTDKQIRNFCIIAHIDHGKSTMADRLLEITGTVDKRKMKAQLLDQMDLERERGITIKLTPVRMQWQGVELNLIDTPGHVDFAYEVSRSLAAVEGVLLLVDATQGIEAQTLANLYLAQKQNLTIIPVINKIDLPAADVETVKADLINLLGCQKEDILLASAKTGEGVENILNQIINRLPAPKQIDGPTKALVFDSFYDEYRGVVSYVRLFSGRIRSGDSIKFISTGQLTEALEVGFLNPLMSKQEMILAGEIGYIVTGLKEVGEAKIGDTITSEIKQTVIPLPGYEEIKPMVYAGIYPKEGDAFNELREAMEKLKLNDASLLYEPESSQALGFGFRCGYLGLLHLEIFRERLKREYELEIVVTTPSVAYQVIDKKGKTHTIHSPEDFPKPEQTEKVLEPIMRVEILTPKKYVGSIMKLGNEKRGNYLDTKYLDEHKAILYYLLPLTSLLVDFYDILKSVSSGYASLSYDFYSYQECELVKMDILVAEESVEALSSLVYKDRAYIIARDVVKSLKEVLPKQMFEVKIQAAISGKIIASEHLSAMRKDVTAKLYGGDVTRKRKLLEKQKKGKKRMKAGGKVEIPTEAFIALLKR